MVDRLGFVPPAEATLPCHDVLHIFKEILTHGLIRHRNLFKFERMNSFTKQSLKNRAHGLASMSKNYQTHERTTMTGTLYLDNVNKFHNMCRLQPKDGLPFQSLSSYLKSIHVVLPEVGDEDDRTVIYDVPSSNVLELRGPSFLITLSSQDINHLLIDNLDLCDDGMEFSVVRQILLGYQFNCQQYPRWQFKTNVLGYITFLLDRSNGHAYRRVIGNSLRRQCLEVRQQGEEDLTTLRNLVTMERPQLEVR